LPFDHGQNAPLGIDGFFRQTGNNVIILVIRETLDEQIATKLA